MDSFLASPDCGLMDTYTFPWAFLGMLVADVSEGIGGCCAYLCAQACVGNCGVIDRLMLLWGKLIRLWLLLASRRRMRRSRSVRLPSSTELSNDLNNFVLDLI